MMAAGYSIQYCSKGIYKDNKPGECKVLNDREISRY
jgi:hypothetical protein